MGYDFGTTCRGDRGCHQHVHALRIDAADYDFVAHLDRLEEFRGQMRRQVDLLLTIRQKAVSIAVHIEQKLGDGAACLWQRFGIERSRGVVARVRVRFWIVMRRDRGVSATWVPGRIMRRLGWHSNQMEARIWLYHQVNFLWACHVTGWTTFAE